MKQQRPKPTRPANPEKLDPEVKYGDAAKESEEFGEWGTGDKGYKVPSTPGERLRSAWLISFSYPVFLELMVDVSSCAGKTFHTRSVKPFLIATVRKVC